MTPKIVDKEEKRHHILEAAIRVFAKLGLPNAKMIHIAEAAGIGKGTIYEYFKSKEELFQAAFHAFIDQAMTYLNKKVKNINDPEEKLRMYFIAWTEILDSDLLEFMDIVLDMWAAGLRLHEGQDKFHLSEMYREYRIQLTDILEDGIRKGVFKSVNTTITASLIIGTLDGLMIQWIMDRNIYQLKEAILQMSDIIISGLKN